MPDPDKLFRTAIKAEDFSRAAVLAKRVSLELGRDGRTAFYLAAAAGATEAARVLLDRGADPHACDPEDWSASRRACLAGAAELVSLLIERGLIREPELPSLLEASLASFGRVKRVVEDPEAGLSTIRLLLHQGVDVTAPSLSHVGHSLAWVAGAMLLHRRVAPRVHARLVELFVAHGATVDELFDDQAQDALCQIAKIAGHEPLLECVYNMGAKSGEITGKATVLHGLAERDASADELNVWLHRGAEVDARDASGRTPFLIACESLAMQSARALVERGANVHATDSEGRNALSNVRDRLQADSFVSWLTGLGVAAPGPNTPASRNAGTASALVPSDARPAKIVLGHFKGFDAHVTLRSDGKFDAVISVFGRALALVLDSDQVQLL